MYHEKNSTDMMRAGQVSTFVNGISLEDQARFDSTLKMGSLRQKSYLRGDFHLSTCGQLWRRL